MTRAAGARCGARGAWAVAALVTGFLGCASPDDPPGAGGPDLLHCPAPGALGPYSGSVATGGLLFVSGQIGERGGSFEHEVVTALDALDARLRDGGADLGALVSVTVYLTDMGDYAAFNALYAARVPAPHPARTCVAVSALPGGARVELSAVARTRADR